jgi:activator of Hsp90 ATPase-like protein
MTFKSGITVQMRVERVAEPAVFGFTWQLPNFPADDPRRTYVEFTLEPMGAVTRLRVVETGFAQLPEDSRRKTYDSHVEGWSSELGELAVYLDDA